jgi:predicted O-methyltransferase YrrM
MMTPEELVDWVNNVPELGSTPMGKGPDVPAHLSIYTRREMMLLAKYAVQIPKYGTAVEIGVYVGHTASILLNLQEELALDIILVDNWSWMMPDARNSYDKMMAENFTETPVCELWMTSAEAHQFIMPSQLIDFIHIDACHDRGSDGVDNDCKLWLPHLRSGGVAVFHDADHIPVAQTIEEYCAAWSGEGAGRTAVRIKP